MEEKINHLCSLSSEDLFQELNSKGNSKFIEQLSKLKKINKETNKQLIQIFQKLKLINDDKSNNLLSDILSNQKISKMLKAFPSKELTEIFNYIKKYKKKVEKNSEKVCEKKTEKNIKSQKEETTITKIEQKTEKNIKAQKEETTMTKIEQKTEKKESIIYKDIDISLKNLLNQQIPFDFIENTLKTFDNINSFVDYYFKKEYYDNYKSIIDMYNIMNLNESNDLNIVIYKNIIITNLEVRCNGIFLSIEFEKVQDIKNKFKHENLLVISSLDSSFIFITEIYLNPYSTKYLSPLNYFTPPIKENYQKIKVKLINVDVLKKLCLISNEVEFQMFEYENELSLSKVCLKTIQELDTKTFSIPGNLERIFNFEYEEHKSENILQQIKDSFFNPRKIYNIFLRGKLLISMEETISFTDFISEILNLIDSPLLIVSKNNRSVDNILLDIYRTSKYLKIKKITGHYNNYIINRNLYYNYHCLGYENKELDEKIKYEWHNLKRSLSENRVNSKTIKYCQTIYNSIIDDFYEISGLKRTESKNVKSQIMECFLNERNLKSFIQSQIRNNPEEYLLKFSIFLNCIDKDYKIRYLWERFDNKYTHESTKQWKEKNFAYWKEQKEEEYGINELEEEDEEDYENDDFLLDSKHSEEENNKKTTKKEKINENKNIIIQEYVKTKNNKNKNSIRKNYWLLDENERREFIKKIQEQINEYDFNNHNNLIKGIEQYEKEEIEYSYGYLKNENIIGMTIYNGIKLKEIIEKMRINTIIINNPQEVSNSALISLFHPKIKNIFYLFSRY